MSSKTFSAGLVALVAIAVASGSGCVTQGPSLGLLAIPIPISPYFQKKKEDEFWIKERYDRVPILPPLTAGGPDAALIRPATTKSCERLSGLCRSKAVCRSCTRCSGTISAS